MYICTYVHTYGFWPFLSWGGSPSRSQIWLTGLVIWQVKWHFRRIFSITKFVSDRQVLCSATSGSVSGVFLSGFYSTKQTNKQTNTFIVQLSEIFILLPWLLQLYNNERRSSWREAFFTLVHLLWSLAPRWGDLRLASQWVYNPIYSHPWRSPLETYLISTHELISRIS